MYALIILGFLGCASERSGSRGPESPAVGDEIIVCGTAYHTGSRVVLWTEPGGYNAYDLTPTTTHGPRFGTRHGLAGLNPRQLSQLQQLVDQFVIHYDAAGVSRSCFQTLQFDRGLSVHFMIDIDGTIYQTLDLKERAWHATRSNDRSIGVEMANIGVFQTPLTVQQWYATAPDGLTQITLPARLGDGGVRTGIQGLRPARNQPVTGAIQGVRYHQYDFTARQYAALIKLTATLCNVFPNIRADVPRNPDGSVMSHVMTDAQWANFRGILGHYHVDKAKQDPGPAFDWERLLSGVRATHAGAAKSVISLNPDSGSPTFAER